MVPGSERDHRLPEVEAGWEGPTLLRNNTRKELRNKWLYDNMNACDCGCIPPKIGTRRALWVADDRLSGAIQMALEWLPGLVVRRV